MGFTLGKKWIDTQLAIDFQEIKDFRRFKSVVTDLFGDKIVDLQKRERFKPTDALMTATTKNTTFTYNVELKTTTKTYYIDEGFILKKYKYNNIKRDVERRGGNEKPIICYFADSTHEYYIFNLNDIDENTRQGELTIKRTEYDPESDKETVEVYYLDTKDAVCHGHFVDLE